MDNIFEIITCKVAASEVREVLGLTVLCPHVAGMLRDLDKCQGGACPGHRRLDVVQGALAREARDVGTVALLALLN